MMDETTDDATTEETPVPGGDDTGTGGETPVPGGDDTGTGGETPADGTEADSETPAM